MVFSAGTIYPSGKTKAWVAFRSHLIERCVLKAVVTHDWLVDGGIYHRASKTFDAETRHCLLAGGLSYWQPAA